MLQLRLVAILALMLLLAAVACTAPPLADEGTVTPEMAIAVEPPQGEQLPCGDEASGVLLQAAAVEKTIADRRFFNPSPEPMEVSPGDDILIVSGRIENSSDRRYVAMSARGIGRDGSVVSRTLDAAHIAGQASFTVDPDSTSNFALHLSYVENVEVVAISACAYEIPPP